MKRNKLTDALMKTALEKCILDIQADPEKGMSKLIELGNRYAATQAQKDFLKTAAKELRNREGAYFKLVERAVRNADAKVLTEFVINLGYNALSEGARTIRELEAKNSYRIPWTIFFDMSWGKYPDLGTVESLLQQGIGLGVFCHMFHIDRKYPDMDGLLERFSKHADCAFVLLLHPAMLTQKLVSKILSLKSILVLLDLDGGSAEHEKTAAELLITNKCLCGGFVRYSAGASPAGAGGNIDRAERLGLPLICLLRNEKLSPLGTDEMQRFISHSRMNLKTPIAPIDLWEDLARVDRSISGQAGLVTVSGGDQLIITDMEKRLNRGGIDLRRPLGDILKETLPKR